MKNLYTYIYIFKNRFKSDLRFIQLQVRVMCALCAPRVNSMANRIRYCAWKRANWCCVGREKFHDDGGERKSA